MICPECNGKGKTTYFVEVDRDENSVTVKKREGICRMCNGSGKQPMTNGDRIRAMSDEKIADWLARTQIANVAEALKIAKIPWEQSQKLKDEVAKDCLEWLKQPVEDE